MTPIGSPSVSPTTTPTSTPPADLAVTARSIGTSGDVDAAATFVRQNPDQRGAVEDGMLAAGDLSGISELAQKLFDGAKKLVSDVIEKVKEAGPVDGIQRSGFATANEAGRAAVAETNPASIRDNLEYGGWVYRAADGTFGYTKPGVGDGASFDLNSVSVPPGTTQAGFYHTHADYSVQGPDGNPVRTSDPTRDDYNSDNFSQTDINLANRLGLQSYLGTPSGNFLHHNPDTGTIGPLN